MLSFDEMGKHFGITIYSDLVGNIFLETWGTSTKHPDSIYDFQTFKESWAMDEIENIYCWVLSLATETLFFPHVRDFVEFANEILSFINNRAKQG